MSLRKEVSRYAESWVGQSEIIPREAISLKYPKLYGEAGDQFLWCSYNSSCLSFFSKLDTCSRKTDNSEMDRVRSDQLSSTESQHIKASGVRPHHISKADYQTQRQAAMLRKKTFTAVPNERQQGKHVLTAEASEKYLEVLVKHKNKNREWVMFHDTI